MGKNILNEKKMSEKVRKRKERESEREKKVRKRRERERGTFFSLSTTSGFHRGAIQKLHPKFSTRIKARQAIKLFYFMFCINKNFFQDNTILGTIYIFVCSEMVRLNLF